MKKIIVSETATGFEARNGDDSEDPTMGYGQTPSEAIGHFVISHAPSLNIEIVREKKGTEVAT